MNSLDEQYKMILRDILINGEEKENRTQCKTLSVFHKSLKIDLRDGFPLLTTKKVFARGFFEEQLLFLRGDTNTKHLEEKKVNYWKGNTSRDFLDSRNLNMLPEGDLGCGYPHQYRNFNGEHQHIESTKGLLGIDQLQNVIETIKHDPWSRRNIISLWNPQQLNLMALPPCHNYIQFVCNPKNNTLDLFFLMRSSDFFLGWPGNIVQYGFFLHFISQIFDLQPRFLSYTGVDVHLYENQLEVAKIQADRESYALPSMSIKKNIKSLEDILQLEWKDIIIKNYNCHTELKAEMII